MKAPRLPRWLVKSVTVLAMLTVLAGVCLAVFLKPYKERAAAMDLAVVSESPGIAYERLPQHLVHAIVAAEDNRFFDHGGLDMKGICRASLVNLRTKSKAQGASTITQQLARQSFGILEKTMDRKLVEAFLALRIEGFAGVAVLASSEENRKWYQLALSCFFFYSIVGHTVADDDLIPLATFMFICSTSAFAAIILEEDGGEDDEEEEKRKKKK